jgi:hypothetical protein
MNIEHTYAKGRACIGLNKKARLILHGGYPIMAYYNPIILSSPFICADKVLLVLAQIRQNLWKDWSSFQ